MAPQSYQLVMKVGPTPGTVIPLDQNEIVVGRDASNDIVINDAEVSRKHAHFYMGPAGYTLEDLGSTNGTFVNGQRLVALHAMRPGEVVMFGEHVELTFEAAALDLNATFVGGPALVGIPAAPAPTPAFQETPAFSGQVPPGPAEPVDQAAVPEPKRKTKTWLLAGCGCLLVLCCVLGVGAFLFDKFNLYCTSPFDVVFSLVGSCP
jgi:predicted component of type VI protein secretion system